MNEKDILNLENLNSIIRVNMLEKKEVKLSDFDYEPYHISDTYTKVELTFETGDLKEIREKIEPISADIESKEYNNAVFTALYEATLNAFQHGNKKDLNKKIIVAYKAGERKLDMIVEDEGNSINPNFIPFILAHREGLYKKKFTDFYEFSGVEKPNTNNGTGTSFMHQYMDEIQYLMAPKGGLIVRMLKNK